MTMTMQADETPRPDFEAWLNPGHHEGNVSAWVAPGRYEEETHQLAWLAWQAARTKTLEDAAQAAGPEDSYQDEWFKAKADAVRRIRSLAST